MAAAALEEMMRTPRSSRMRSSSTPFQTTVRTPDRPNNTPSRRWAPQELAPHTPRRKVRVSNAMPQLRDIPGSPPSSGEERLEREVHLLRELDPDMRDWRTMDPEFFLERWRQAAAFQESRTLLATALFVGTAQACLRGEYWAPSFGSPDSISVDCGHHALPISRLYDVRRLPFPENMKAKAGHDGSVNFACFDHCHPLDAVTRLNTGRVHTHVAIVRCTPIRDHRNFVIRYQHCLEDQLFLRTTYWQSYEKIERQIHMPVGEVLNAGALIYTPEVAVLRGTLDQGAQWLRNPPRCDVIWVGVPARPRITDKGVYAEPSDRFHMETVIEGIFAWAAAHEVEVLVLPPIGCQTPTGSHHPPYEVADIIRNTALNYAQYIQQVCIASDWPGHNNDQWWFDFTRCVQTFKPLHARPGAMMVPSVPRFRNHHAEQEELHAEKRKLIDRSIRSQSVPWKTGKSLKWPRKVISCTPCKTVDVM